MGTFIVAYLVIWLAVAGYAALLGVQQHRFAKEIEELRAEFTQQRNIEGTTSKAA